MPPKKLFTMPSQVKVENRSILGNRAPKVNDRYMINIVHKKIIYIYIYKIEINALIDRIQRCRCVRDVETDWYWTAGPERDGGTSNKSTIIMALLMCHVRGCGAPIKSDTIQRDILLIIPARMIYSCTQKSGWIETENLIAALLYYYGTWLTTYSWDVHLHVKVYYY